MNNNNIVKIGTALKWRSTFDINKRYYQENIVTMCGCVFRCKILLAQGKSPVDITDDYGHIKYANPDIWDVIVDMAHYYNFVIDCEEAIKNVTDRSEQNSNSINEQQKEIERLKRENNDQWYEIDKSFKYLENKFDKVSNDLLDKINEFAVEFRKQIEDLAKINEDELDKIYEYQELHEIVHQGIDKALEEFADRLAQIDQTDEMQQRQINYLLYRISVCSNGIWDNGLMWVDESYWENNYTEQIPEGTGNCEQCNERLQELESSMIELTNKYNEQQTIIDKQQQQIEQLLGALISAAIKSYDGETGTIYFADHISVDDQNTDVEALVFTDSLSLRGYDEDTEKVYVM